MRRAAVLLAAVAALVCAAPAGAHHQRPPADLDRLIAESVDVARAAWPQSPCRGREDVRVDDASQALLDEHDAGGIAVPSACIVGMPREAGSPVAWCTILVHEFGHLAGMGHSADASSPMHTPPPTWPPCRSLREEDGVTFHPTAAARERLRDRLSHDWSCDRVSPDLVRCEGEPRDDAHLDGVATYRRESPQHGWVFSVGYA